MNLPSLPTDNLYKFCAITGSALALFSLIFLMQKTFEAKDDLNRVTTESEILRLKSSYLGTDISRLEQRSKHLTNDVNAALAEKRGDDWRSLKDRNTGIAKTLQKVDADTRKLATMRIQLRGKIAHSKDLVARAWIYLAAALIFAFGGLFLASYGFLRWYVLLQKPTDILMWRRAEDDSDTKESGEKQD